MENLNLLKNIEFCGEISGNGVVCFDGDNQLYLMRQTSCELPTKNGMVCKNIMYAKKNFYMNEDGSLDYKLKISSNSLRHDIFGEVDEFIPSRAMCDKKAYVNYLVSPTGFIRGYMFADKGNTDVRKSALRITDAIQSNNVVSHIETFSKSGYRDSNSLFYKETCGDINYSFRGNIDMKLLQFVSSDPVCGRCALPKDCIDSGLVDLMLRKHYPWHDNEKVKRGFFRSTSLATQRSYSEYGLLLDQELCYYLCKRFLKSLLNYSSSATNNGYAKLTSLKIRFVTDVMCGENERGEWIEVKTSKDIDDLEIPQMYYYYEEADKDDVRFHKECSLSRDVSVAKENLASAEEFYRSLEKKINDGQSVTEKRVEDAKNKIELAKETLKKAQDVLDSYLENK